ncbi:DUF6000 family protein [Lentzea flava]|uniref:Uncharacterized protein n=1 Tax=Lentzea flava TaxID=103732 RepID=A0ABQ2V1X8_9PSEU|nr:DUF6000 family protein [Lentzea flava]MCP2203041.1 hypothetical protein [Lentzea flava]GGU65178.1 hypothetical protein GCM10010178_66470 [Lentzea flava]
MHLKLLHANFLNDPDRDTFVAGIVERAHTSTDDEIESLLRATWREKLIGAYLAGFARRKAFRDRIGVLLVDSATCYAGQGYCFALAAFGEPDDAEWLATYLDRWLPELDRQYDQPWAMGALLHIDPVRAATFTDAWTNWITNGCHGIGYRGLTDERETIKRLCNA